MSPLQKAHWYKPIQNPRSCKNVMSAMMTGPNVSPGDAPMPQRTAEPRKELYVFALARQMQEAVVTRVAIMATGRRPNPRESGINLHPESISCNPASDLVHRSDSGLRGHGDRCPAGFPCSVDVSRIYGFRSASPRPGLELYYLPCGILWGNTEGYLRFWGCPWSLVGLRGGILPPSRAGTDSESTAAIHSSQQDMTRRRGNQFSHRAVWEW
jgi:hypothetical protein